MKKRFWILATLLALSLLAAVTAAALCTAQESDEPDGPAVEGGYILTASEGTLGIFRDGELILRTDVPLATLREADRVQVEAGIRLESYEEALMLLEDFGA